MCHTCQLTGEPSQVIEPVPLCPFPLVSQLFDHLCKSVTKVGKIKGRNRKERSKDEGSSTVLSVPQISAKIPKLNSLCASPSLLECLVGTLFGRIFVLCLSGGDTDSPMVEVCDRIFALSGVLGLGRVFGSIQEALDCVLTFNSGGDCHDEAGSHPLPHMGVG